MSANGNVDPAAVLAELKDFQRRTATWAFERMFDADDPSLRFLVADEVGLGKTHVAKGVVAQVIDHLRRCGDERHDIVYVCSNAAIARQNLRKLVPKGIEPLESVERLTMLPLAQLDEGAGDASGVNLLAITPGTSLKFGRDTGQFEERCLAYTFLRAHWGPAAMPRRARRIFWRGVHAGDPDGRLRDKERRYRPLIGGSVGLFAEQMRRADERRVAQGLPTLRELFDSLVDGLAHKRSFPQELVEDQRELIGDVRRIMAVVGIEALQPDLVILDEFQRFKDLLSPDPDNFATDLAHRLFDYTNPASRRRTRTLLLSATPYRMYTTADDVDGDHYADFITTCSFLISDAERVARLQERFAALRTALATRGGGDEAESICAAIGDELRRFMARSERLAATPDRDGMLREVAAEVELRPVDVAAYLRIGDLAEAVEHHEPTEYWKSGPYLLNFMERYKLKQALEEAVAGGGLADEDGLEPGAGLLDWEAVERYGGVDPQNGRVRWLVDQLDRHKAFELLWLPPSLRYYDAGSVYESEEARGFTKRLVFSGWALVPKVVSALVSFESERRAFAQRDHRYSDRERGGRRLTFRTDARAPEAGDAAPGGPRRAAAMTTFLFVWPSPSLARLGHPRGHGARPAAGALLDRIEERVAERLAPLVAGHPADGTQDQRWYWAAPLLLDAEEHPEATRSLLDDAYHWEEEPGKGFLTHLQEAREMLDGAATLGRPPDDLARVLAELALGGPANCFLRAMSAVSGLAFDDPDVLSCAAWSGSAFRSFFNAPEVTGIVTGRAAETEEAVARYWRDVVQHAIGGSLQAVLDEHLHVLRDWLGHLDLEDEGRRAEAVWDIGATFVDAIEARTASFRVDVPKADGAGRAVLERHSMRSRFAAAFGNQAFDESGEARIETISNAFNSPFWPFVMTSTSVGQEGLDFHLWCHAVVHWNLPSNPVDLEQREGRVHRYKGLAVRRNIAASLGDEVLAASPAPQADVWEHLFARAAETRADGDSEMVPYWVFHDGPARIERHVPMLPFSREVTALPRLRKSLAAYRLAFGQPRQEELVEYLGATHTTSELQSLAAKLRIDLTPPQND